MERSKYAVVNQLPTQTYRFLRVNAAGLTIPETASPYVDAWQDAALPAGVTLSRCAHFAELPKELLTIESGMGAGIDGALAERGIPVAVLTAKENAEVKEPVLLPVEILCGTATMMALAIHATAGSDVTVLVNMIEDTAGCAAARSFFGISTKIYAERGARVRLVHVQRPGAEITNFDDIGGFCEEDARIELVTLFLGGKKRHWAESFLGTRVTLAGDRSVFVNRTGYYLAGQMPLDMNYVVDQRGKDTVSDMIFRGVLTDHAKKTWRGTIDFKQGSAGSAGDEQEDTLMLSPHVRNISVPVILCAEEDVDGRHGASIGQLSEEMLFYMRSRGYSEEDARRLIVQARLKSIAKELPDAKLRWEVEQWIEREIA